MHPGIVEILGIIDFVVCIIFFLDFLINLTVADSKLGYFLKWGWVDLLSSIPMINYSRIGRLARIIRIFRVLRGVKSAKILIGHIAKKRAESILFSSGLITIVLIMLGSISILHFETELNSNISDAEDAVWWSFVTITTVGYGDFYPVTTEGRIIASILMLGGIGLFGVFTGYMANVFMGNNQGNDAG